MLFASKKKIFNVIILLRVFTKKLFLENHFLCMSDPTIVRLFAIFTKQQLFHTKQNLPNTYNINQSSNHTNTTFKNKTRTSNSRGTRKFFVYVCFFESLTSFGPEPHPSKTWTAVKVLKDGETTPTRRKRSFRMHLLHFFAVCAFANGTCTECQTVTFLWYVQLRLEINLLKFTGYVWLFVDSAFFCFSEVLFVGRRIDGRNSVIKYIYKI